jgi:hypothetical protein
MHNRVREVTGARITPVSMLALCWANDKQPMHKHLQQGMPTAEMISFSGMQIPTHRASVVATVMPFAHRMLQGRRLSLLQCQFWSTPAAGR